jgi:uncharacterized RDD family membrane protein YckC
METSLDTFDSPTAATPAEPAPLAPRIWAGVVDALILGTGASLLSLAPLFYNGFTLPLLGSLVAVLVYTILPCSLFKATLGMRIFGLEIVGLDGRSADPGEIAFRELVLRGYFGVAYFSTAAFGLAGYLSGRMAFFQPSGIGLVLFFLSGFLLLLSGIGHLMILVRPDRRGFPDLVAKTMVVKRGAAKDPTSAAVAELDEEERRGLVARDKQRVWKFAVFAGALLVATLAVPQLLTEAGRGKEDLPDRWRLEEAERKWKKDPANALLAADVIEKYEMRGEHERAGEIRVEHRAALETQKREQEAALRASFARAPADWGTVETLLELFEEQGRKTDAIAIWETYVAAEKSSDARASFGVWLYQHDENARAVKELETAIAAGTNAADAYGYLGMANKELGKKAEARAAFEKALELDPEFEDVIVELDALSEDQE